MNETIKYIIGTDGSESWFRNGDEIYYKSPDGEQQWWDYDEKGRVKHYKNDRGTEFWYIGGNPVNKSEYDIHYKRG